MPSNCRPSNWYGTFFSIIVLSFFVELQPTEIAELLHALALDLGAVDVALAVDADEVKVVELAELMADASPRADEVAAGSVDHVELAVRVVNHEQVGLRRVRP